MRFYTLPILAKKRKTSRRRLDLLEAHAVLFHQGFDLGDEFNVASGFPMVCQHPDYIGIVGDNRHGDTLARERGQCLANSFQRGLVVGRAC